jgi:hypothetical protein
MKLTIFYGDKGDCLLLTSQDGRSILCDGGMPSSYPGFVAPKLRDHLPQNGDLDVVYVSHIDEDHIGGVLSLLDSAFDWRVFRLHQQAGDSDFKEPRSLEPPAIRNLWHNSFHDLLKENKGDIESMLAANALALRLVDAAWARYAGAVSANLANSIPQAMRVSRRVGASQLDIPLNRPAEGKLMMVRQHENTARIGSMRLTTIGPAPEDLKKLRDEWNKWLRNQKNRKALQAIRKQARADEDLLQTGFPPADAARLLGAAKLLGDRDQVTPPNLASLMFHVEENGRTLLLTGDGHSDDVVRGLERTGKLQSGQGLHVDVLKVPHHGSEHNTRRSFPRRVTADHYVFCGNGFSGNPDLEVLRAYLASRLGKPSELSPNAEVARPFHFWFSSSAAVAPPSYKPHMRKVEKLVRDAAQASASRLQLHFLESDPLVLP